MPRYRFSWENLSPALISALCDPLDLKGDDRADSLRASSGARPKPAFVRDAWPVLRDGWLVDDAASRAAVLDQLRKARLASADAPVETQAEQMAYLRSCHNQLVDSGCLDQGVDACLLPTHDGVRSRTGANGGLLLIAS